MYSKMHPQSLIVAACVLCPVWSYAQTAAQDQRAFYISFGVPGAGDTQPVSINDRFWVTGSYTDANGNTRGFVRDGRGRISTFDVGGSTYTFPEAIDFAGDVAGTYNDANAFHHSFLRYADGTFATSFEPPDSLNSQVIGMNEEGTVLGLYTETNSTPPAHGYLRCPNGMLTIFDYPGSIATLPSAINAEGEVTGIFQSVNNGVHSTGAFLRLPNGEFTSFVIPQSNPPNISPLPTAINARGEIAGLFFDNDGTHEFVRARDGRVTTFDIPGVGGFVVLSSRGTVAGSLVEPDPSNLVRGFLRHRTGTVTPFDVPGSVGTQVAAINAFDAVTGRYFTTPGTLGYIRIIRPFKHHEMQDGSHP